MSRMQIQVGKITDLKSPSFQIQLPKNAKFLTMTLSQQGPLLHFLSEVDDILVERSFLLVPSGATFDNPGELRYCDSLSSDSLTLNLFEVLRCNLIV